MDTDLLYRTGTQDDLPQLKDLGILAYSEFSKILKPEKWEIMRANLGDDENLSRLLRTSKAFVCTETGRIVGMAYLVPRNNPTPIYPAEWAYIRLLGVHPDYRGQGIAKRLTQQCIAHARAAGETTLGLHTSDMMDAARHIYETLGFKRLREIENPYGVSYWLYSLEL